MSAAELGDRVILVSPSRARVHIVADRIVVWVLTLSGLAMGGFVMRAHSLRSAQFTALSELPGWPETWGLVLLLAGIVAVTGRAFDCRWGRIQLAVGMSVMSLWYLLFASSLVLGSAQYGFCPYYGLAALHCVYAIKGALTKGFRPEGLTLPTSPA